MADLYNISISDGAEEWRKQEAEDLSDLVQRRLYHLQVLHRKNEISLHLM